MTSVCLYFKVHRPYRLKNFEAVDIDLCHCYEDETADRQTIDQLADRCCLPANAILYEQIIKHKGKFRASFSVSGVVLELFQRYRPDVIRSFQELAQTGCIEFLAETYYHSLSSLYSVKEFKRQVEKHAALIKNLFWKEPTVFRNTELIHNNRVATLAGEMGLKAILCEGTADILHGRDCNQLYRSPGNENIYLLLRNATLSDDIAFRFGDSHWSEHPMTAAKYAEWLHHYPASTELVNLFMDYETFGVYKTADSGIFHFLELLPAAVLSKENYIFSTPSEITDGKIGKDIYDVPQTISWENGTDKSFAWCRNVMQNNTLKKIYSLDNLVLQLGDAELDTWGRLQSADYFYYMSCSQNQAQGQYANPFPTARDSFRYYTNLVADFEISMIKKIIANHKKNTKLKNIPFNTLTN